MIEGAVANRVAMEPVFNWAERDSCARLIVDDDLMVEWLNEAAQRMLVELDSFRVRGGRLQIVDEGYRGPFRSLVCSSREEVRTIRIPQPANSYLLCTSFSIGPHGVRRLTGLTLRRLIGSSTLDTDALESDYSLTLAERRIVASLFAGRTAEESCEGLHVSLGTVRTHIRHIYEKLNVGSREAMFHKLIPYLSNP